MRIRAGTVSPRKRHRSRRSLLLFSAGIAVLAGAVPVAGCLWSVGPGKLLPIESAIQVRLQEDLGASGRESRLLCATTAPYGCAGYRIVTMRHRFDVDFVEFVGVRSPDGPCATVVVPATATVPLGTLPASGTLRFRFAARGETVDATVHVTPDSFAIEPASASEWVAFPAPVLRRVPPDLLWGVIGYGSPSQEPLVEAFLDALQAIGAEPNTLPPGSYGYFDVDSTGTIDPGNHGYWYARTFHYVYRGTDDALAGVVHAHGDSLGIRVHRGTGATFFD